MLINDAETAAGAGNILGIAALVLELLNVLL